MKMKEFSAKVNIPETTIRYYISNGIFIPERYTENYMGRKNFDFSENDVEQLNRIALLRKYDFSIKEIKELSENKLSVTETLEKRIENAQQKVNSENEALKKLRDALLKNPSNSNELCEALNSPTVEQTPIPHIDESSAYKPMYEKTKKTAMVVGTVVGLLLIISFFLFQSVLRNSMGYKYGDVTGVNIHYVESELHSQQEIHDATEVVINRFEKHYHDCTLLDIEYGGDEWTSSELGYCGKTDAKDVMVIVLTFKTGSGQFDAFEPDTVYSGWSYILKKEFGQWVVVSYGYA